MRTKKELAEIKKNLLNQNAINLTNIELNQHQQSLLKKGPSFIPTPKDVNWFNLRQDFDKFTNQLRTKFNQAIDKRTEKKKTQTSPPIIAVIMPGIIAIIMSKYQKRNIKLTTFTGRKRQKISI